MRPGHPEHRTPGLSASRFAMINYFMSNQNETFPAAKLFADNKQSLEAILGEYLKFGSADGPEARRLFRAELKVRLGMPLADYEQDAVNIEAKRRGLF